MGKWDTFWSVVFTHIGQFPAHPPIGLSQHTHNWSWIEGLKGEAHMTLTSAQRNPLLDLIDGLWKHTRAHLTSPLCGSDSLLSFLFPFPTSTCCPCHHGRVLGHGSHWQDYFFITDDSLTRWFSLSIHGALIIHGPNNSVLPSTLLW